ncbi:MAG: type II toxin-antitoxin system RelE/ParE family toxin [Campylobacterales bacterium]
MEEEWKKNLLLWKRLKVACPHFPKGNMEKGAFSQGAAQSLAEEYVVSQAASQLGYRPDQFKAQVQSGNLNAKERAALREAGAQLVDSGMFNEDGSIKSGADFAGWLQQMSIGNKMSMHSMVIGGSRVDASLGSDGHARIHQIDNSSSIKTGSSYNNDNSHKTDHAIHYKDGIQTDPMSAVAGAGRWSMGEVGAMVAGTGVFAYGGYNIAKGIPGGSVSESYRVGADGKEIEKPSAPKPERNAYGQYKSASDQALAEQWDKYDNAEEKTRQRKVSALERGKETGANMWGGAKRLLAPNVLDHGTEETLHNSNNKGQQDTDQSKGDSTTHRTPPNQDGRNGSGVENNNNTDGEKNQSKRARRMGKAALATTAVSFATNAFAGDGQEGDSLWGSMAEGAMNGGMMGMVAGPKGAAFGAIGGALYGAYQHFAGGGEGGGQQQVAQQNINVANATLQANTNAAGNFAQSGQGSFATPGGTVSIGADAQVMASCNGGVAAVAFCVHTWPRIFGGLWKQLRLSTLFLLYSFGYNTPMFKIYKTESFAKWQAGLKDIKTRAAIVRRLERVEQGNFGDHAAIGGGVSEMRIFLGPGYRLYYTIRGEEIVVLLAGGDKSTQEKDIKKAKAMAKELK